MGVANDAWRVLVLHGKGWGMRVMGDGRRVILMDLGCSILCHHGFPLNFFYSLSHKSVKPPKSSSTSCGSVHSMIVQRHSEYFTFTKFAFGFDIEG